MSGLEIILEDQRIATNGDVRPSPTPSPWDPIPEFESQERGSGRDEIAALCKYGDQGLSYRLDLRPETGGFRLAVQLDGPLPDSLVGKAGLNLEFLPSLYFGKSYLADAEPGFFLVMQMAPWNKHRTRSLNRYRWHKARASSSLRKILRRE